MTDWKNDEAFLHMDPVKQDMICQLSDSLEGRQLNEALPLITQWKKKMQAQNIVFTPAENQLLTNILFERMTPAQKKQFQYLQSFMKGHAKH